MPTQTLEIQVIAQRLEKLERQNTYLKRVGAAVLLIAAAFALMGQAAPESRVINAQALFIRDAKGRVRATLGIGSDGGPHLFLYDSEGVSRENMTVNQYGPFLYFLDAAGKPRIELSIASQTKFQPASHPPGAIRLRTRTTPAWALAAGIQGIDYFMPNPDTESPGLFFYDATGGERLILEADGGASSMGLGSYDLGNTAWLTAGKGGPRLFLRDKEDFKTILGSTQLVSKGTGETSKRSTASIELLNKAGEIWSVP